MGRWVVAVFAVLAALWLVPAQGRALGFEVSGSREGQSLNVLVEYGLYREPRGKRRVSGELGGGEHGAGHILLPDG